MFSVPATVRISVTSVNDAPVLSAIGNKTVVKGATLSFTAKASDADAGQTKTFSLISAPSGAAINATSGVFSWKPSATGTYTFKVRVTDNGSPILYDEKQITVTVFTATITSLTALKPSNEIAIKTGTPVLPELKMYPNPVTDRFTIAFNIPVEKVTAIIADIKGVTTKILNQHSAKTNKLEMNIADLKPGVYFIQLQTEFGRQTLKFVKM